MSTLPGKTVERLSQYRRFLYKCLDEEKQYIFSHELAAMLHLTSVQVRRDLMLIGYSGTLRKGYHVAELIGKIGLIIDTPEGMNVALIGVGNLGRAIINYLQGKRPKLFIKACFDIDPAKVGKKYSGVPCYHEDDMAKVVKELGISICIITVPAQFTVRTAEIVIGAGIKGILNYTSTPLNLPQGTFLEEYDMITSLEKVAYFAKWGEEDKNKKLKFS